ncbi:MAG: hypothetical protein KA477_01980 [Candidatus Levybacteria bacterium]|nr:hypothetical protein [Candidatus Levybacteria bacterium]
MIENIISSLDQDTLARFVLIVFVGVYGLLALVLAFQVQVLDRMVRQVTFSPIFRLLAFANAIISAILIIILLFTL